MTDRNLGEGDAVDVDSLPHWARVAFAARCARQVAPLFERSWPDGETHRAAAVRLAAELAERSAAEGRAAEGLKSAESEAVVTAGAAMRAVYGFATKEPMPKDEGAATIASLVANCAGRAALAARAAPADSRDAAWDAYGFARDAAGAASALAVLIGIDEDFAALRRAAVRGRWTDETAVPPSSFDAR